KARQTWIDLDTARCNENWANIPELAKRYKKYHPSESVLELTARLEAEFVQLIRQIRHGKYNNEKKPDICYQLDDPNHISISPVVQPSQAQLILFSKIVLARIYFETGRYEKAVEWLQQLALRLEDVESGYGLVLLIQARVIKGICFELQDNLGDALEAYSSALQSAEQHPEEKNKALWFWLEDCLYRSILLQLRKKGPVKQTLTLMRTYLHYCQTQWPADWRIHKRWIIFRHYIRYLTKAYQKDVYSNQTDLHHRTLELSNLLVLAHDTIGWGTDESYLRRLAKFYYRTQKLVMTESVCISRHLFYVLLRLGELKEAKAAFTRYLEMLGVKDCQWGVISLGNKDNDDSDDDSNDMDDIVKTLQTKLASIVQTSLASANKNLSNLERIHTTNDDSEMGIARKAPTGSFENDTEFEVVRLLLAAAQQLYGQLEERWQEASALSDLATVILEESEHLKKKKANQWRSLMVQSRRTTGIAYGLYASQCQDRKQRSRCLSESLIALKRASELDTRSWQTFYELGLQQLIVGDLSSAIASIKRSIKLRNDFIPSWHLLALIQSSRQLHALPSSLEVIQQVHDYKLHQELYSDPDPLDTEEGQAFFERADSYIKLQMTQVKILEALEGPEAILKTYSGILDTYAALSRKTKFSHFMDDETTIVKAGRRKSSSFGGRDASSIISFASRPRSFSVLSKPTSLGEEDEESQNSTPHQSQTSTLASLPSAHISTVQAIDANSSPKGSSSTIFSSRTNSSQEDHHVSNSSVKHSIIEKKKSVYHCQREARWCSLLVQIWIMISDTYRLTEQFEEAIKALLEADQLTKGQNADVWHRIGLILLSTPQESEITAVDAFNKALSIDSDHVATQISLGSFYVNTQQFDLAEELLKSATHGLGWNQPEAWYLLGQIYREQGNVQDAKEFLLYALKLSDMNPIVHPIDQLLPRFV
ncbi:MAG: hypothetical protein EXX96DRAFT_635056, partial [Benjaminiella poitrasii]